jgi:tetratricopeptide (TPR) repeat protein
MPERAVELFEKAKVIYEGNLPKTDGRLGGLYNNMGLAYMGLKRFGEAYEAFLKALDVMGKVEHGALEQAITYLNLANAVELEHGLEKGERKIGQYLDKAAALLDDPSVPRDGYYAFVCEKCAPSFEYYGYFADAKELSRRAEEIYERA